MDGDSSEDEVFFGPVTEKEKKLAARYHGRKTLILPQRNPLYRRWSTTHIPSTCTTDDKGIFETASGSPTTLQHTPQDSGSSTSMVSSDGLAGSLPWSLSGEEHSNSNTENTFEGSHEDVSLLTPTNSSYSSIGNVADDERSLYSIKPDNASPPVLHPKKHSKQMEATQDSVMCKEAVNTPSSYASVPASSCPDDTDPVSIIRRPNDSESLSSYSKTELSSSPNKPETESFSISNTYETATKADNDSLSSPPKNELPSTAAELNSEPSCTPKRVDIEPSITAAELNSEPPERSDIESSVTAKELISEPSCTPKRSDIEPSIAATELNSKPLCTRKRVDIEPSITARELNNEPPCTPKRVDIEPSITATELNSEPPCTLERADIEPSITATELNSEPSCTPKRADIEPSITVTELNSESSNTPEMADVEPSIIATEPSRESVIRPPKNELCSTTVELDRKPSRTATKLDNEPSSPAMKLDGKSLISLNRNDFFSTTTELDSEPSTTTRKADSEPLSNLTNPDNSELSSVHNPDNAGEFGRVHSPHDLGETAHCLSTSKSTVKSPSTLLVPNSPRESNASFSHSPSPRFNDTLEDIDQFLKYGVHYGEKNITSDGALSCSPALTHYSEDLECSSRELAISLGEPALHGDSHCNELTNSFIDHSREMEDPDHNLSKPSSVPIVPDFRVIEPSPSTDKYKNGLREPSVSPSPSASPRFNDTLEDIEQFLKYGVEYGEQGTTATGISSARSSGISSFQPPLESTRASGAVTGVVDDEEKNQSVQKHDEDQKLSVQEEEQDEEKNQSLKEEEQEEKKNQSLKEEEQEEKKPSVKDEVHQRAPLSVEKTPLYSAQQARTLHASAAQSLPPIPPTTKVGQGRPVQRVTPTSRTPASLPRSQPGRAGVGTSVKATPTLKAVRSTPNIHTPTTSKIQPKVARANLHFGSSAQTPTPKVAGLPPQSQRKVVPRLLPKKTLAPTSEGRQPRPLWNKSVASPLAKELKNNPPPPLVVNVRSAPSTSPGKWLPQSSPSGQHPASSSNLLLKEGKVQRMAEGTPSPKACHVDSKVLPVANYKTGKTLVLNNKDNKENMRRHCCKPATPAQVKVIKHTGRVMVPKPRSPSKAGDRDRTSLMEVSVHQPISTD